MQSVKILTLYEGAIFGEMSFLNGDVACASVVAEAGGAEVYEIKSSAVDNMLSDGDKANADAFNSHLGTYLTHLVRQLTAIVGEAFSSRVTDIPVEEVLSNGVFFSHFKKFMTEQKRRHGEQQGGGVQPQQQQHSLSTLTTHHSPLPLLSSRQLSFLTELNEFLTCPALDQLNYARQLYTAPSRGVFSDPRPARLSRVLPTLQADSVPPRDVFAPVLAVVLSSLQVNAYRLFSQSTAFQPLLDLKAREEQVPMVTDFKLLQILGEGYEGKVLQARKKDCGVCYALKVLDKTLLASRSRRWQMHCSRELECLIACNHPYVVGLAYSFQTPKFLKIKSTYPTTR